MNNNTYYNKYQKYKNKYIKLKLLGGAKHADEQTACEIENILLSKPSKVLIYTLQFPEYFEDTSDAVALSDNSYYQTDSGTILKDISSLKKLFANFYIIRNDVPIYIDSSITEYDNENLTSEDYTNIFPAINVQWQKVN